jgi:hypothetical protein
MTKLRKMYAGVAGPLKSRQRWQLLDIGALGGSFL